MDRIENASDIVKKIYLYKQGLLPDYELINEVCSYFDDINKDNLSEADIKFLRYISNIVGIPHYYDMLGCTTKIDNWDLNTFSSIIYESTLHTSEKSKIHKYQYQIINQFKPEELNRFFLSASTSFGKTFIVFEIIKKMRYRNIVLIFPTIALLSENFEKIVSDPEYDWINQSYKIHTLSEIYELGDNNIFIYTPERFLSFIEKGNITFFDFVFVDEIYKIDNGFIIDQISKENERDVAYRVALFHGLLNDETDALLAGPYIEFQSKDSNKYNPSFDLFMAENHFKLLNYNNYEIVNKSFLTIRGAASYTVEDNFDLSFDSLQKTKRCIDIVESIVNRNENVIIYCSRRADTEIYAKKLLVGGINKGTNTSACQTFIDHIQRIFGADWVVIKALKNRIGIHHGFIPKYIQKEIITLFNQGYLNVLLSTTTMVSWGLSNIIQIRKKLLRTKR